MPIQILAPDGSIAEFPDGMPEAEMNAALAKVYPAPAGGQAPRASSSPGDRYAAFSSPVYPAPAGRR